jgi:hypothetical protein
MFRKMREEILKEESKQRSAAQEDKMRQVEAKIRGLERIRQEKEEKEREQAQEEERQRAQKEQGRKNFLGGIKSYVVEDI